MKTAETKSTHSQQHNSTNTQQPFFNKEQEGAFFSEQSSEYKPFFPGADTSSFIQPKYVSGDKPFFRPATVPLIQAKCATCEAEEGEQQKEQSAAETLDVQRMPAFESEADDNVQRQPIPGSVPLMVRRMPAFESEADDNVQTKPLIQRQTETETEPEEDTSTDTDLQPKLASNAVDPPEDGDENTEGLPFTQAKLTIGKPNDRYEREADAVAEHVMTMPEPGVAKVGTSIKSHGIRGRSAQKLQPKRLAKNKVQFKKQSSFVPTTTPTLETRLNASKGRGKPLQKQTRSFMEPRFGQDFGGVRVHTGSDAVQMNRALGAQAFTHGQDVYFGSGKYSPETGTGKRLVAHELTHVIQQTGNQLPPAYSIQQSKSAYQKNLSKTHQPTIQRGLLGDLWDATGGRVVSGVKDTAKQAAVKVAEIAQSTENALKEGVQEAWSDVSRIAGQAIDASFMWLYRNFKGLIAGGINKLKGKWGVINALAKFVFKFIRSHFSRIIKLIKVSFNYFSDAIINMDTKRIRKSWGSFTKLVLNIWDRFHKMGMGLLNQVKSLWNALNGFATSLFNKVDLLTNHWAFKKLPDSIRKVIYGLINKLRTLWNQIKAKWEQIFNQVKAFVNNAFKTVRKFVDKVLSFAIDTIIEGIRLFGKILLFIRKFIKNPKKYLQPLAQKIASYLPGVQNEFKPQVNKYVGGVEKGVSTAPGKNTSTSTTSKSSKASSESSQEELEQNPSTQKDSATWSEIGSGIWEIMKKKWAEVKKDPLSIVFNILQDLVLPIVGNFEDVEKLFQDIDKILSKPLKTDSFEDFKTTLTQLLDIPILIYNTFWSIVGRTSMVPLIIASFIPHPIVKGIAIAAGYALLAALISGESANIGQKLLLLKKGSTSEEEKQDAYNSLGDSLIALAMEVALAIVMFIVSIVGNIAKAVFSFVKGKVFKLKASLSRRRIKPKRTQGAIGKRLAAARQWAAKILELPQDILKRLALKSIEWLKTIPRWVQEKVRQLSNSAKHKLLGCNSPCKVNPRAIWRRFEKIVEIRDGILVRGFRNAGELLERVGNLRNRLKRIKLGSLELDDIAVGLRGSSVTDLSSKGGKFRWSPKEPMGPSDVDFFFTSPKLERRLDAMKAPFKPDGRMDPKIMEKFMPSVGKALKDFADETTTQLGRKGDAILLRKSLADSLQPGEHIKF